MARASSLARRYAKAYFELARDADGIPARSRELQTVADVLTRPQIADALANPKLPMAQRTRMGLELLDGVAKPARNLARLLIERHRAGLAGEILDRYQELSDQASGIVRARVTTALQPDEQLETKIARALREKFGSAVQTTIVRDPEIIGGLVIRIGDRVLDDSVRTRLQQLQAALA